MFKSKWVKGTATLVGYEVVSTATSEAGFVESSIRAQVVVQAEGVEPTAAQLMILVDEPRLPFPEGYVFDVKVDSGDPTKVRADEDAAKVRTEIAAKREASAANGLSRAEELAAQMRRSSP
jgi:hypothetical protein